MAVCLVPFSNGTAQDIPPKIKALGGASSQIYASFFDWVDKSMAASLPEQSREVMRDHLEKRLSKSLYEFHLEQKNPYQDVRYPYYGFLPLWEIELRLELAKATFLQTRDRSVFSVAWLSALEEEVLESFEVKVFHKDLPVDVLGRHCSQVFIDYFEWKIEAGLEDERKARFAAALENFNRLLDSDKTFRDKTEGLKDEFEQKRLREGVNQRLYTDRQRDLARLNSLRWRLLDDSKLEALWNASARKNAPQPGN